VLSGQSIHRYRSLYLAARHEYEYLFIIIIAAPSLCDALTGCSTFVQEGESNVYNYRRKSTSHGVRAPDLADYLACMTVTANCYENNTVSDLIITPHDIRNSCGALQHCP
jgi:hypothetical protein